jgi:hypothetical protein
MSYIAAGLLLYMETVDAFIALSNLLATPFCSALYTMNLERVCGAYATASLLHDSLTDCLSIGV